MTTKVINGLEYDFQGRSDKKNTAEAIARVWKNRGYKTLIEKAPSQYKGYFLWIRQS